MPAQTFTLLIGAVIIAAGLTVWALSLWGPGVMAAILPVTLAASFLLRRARK